MHRTHWLCPQLITEQHIGIFSEEEVNAIFDNLSKMRTDIQLAHQNSIEHSHYGFQQVITCSHTGGRGRPRIHIDPDFLQAAYTMRSTQGIADFLGVQRSTVRRRLLELGIDEPRENPFIDNPSGIISYTSRVTDVPDAVLDELLMNMRRQHGNEAGISLLRGYLRNEGIFVSRERIRQALIRLFPRRLFHRHPVQRREYSVPGPNALWHHDGQHGMFSSLICVYIVLSTPKGLIRWGIVIHGFIDGHSRLITGLRAADNNKGETVLSLFLEAAGRYNVPMRLRGDHGVENILVAAWMERFRGPECNAYIWGR